MQYQKQCGRDSNYNHVSVQNANNHAVLPSSNISSSVAICQITQELCMQPHLPIYHAYTLCRSQSFLVSLLGDFISASRIYTLDSVIFWNTEAKKNMWFVVKMLTFTSARWQTSFILDLIGTQIAILVSYKGHLGALMSHTGFPKNRMLISVSLQGGQQLKSTS